MGLVIDLEDWRRGKRPESQRHEPPDEPGALPRLEAAIEQLHCAVERAAGPAGRVDPETETEVLAIIGEVTTGAVDAAASRVERLTARLRARAAGEAVIGRSRRSYR